MLWFIPAMALQYPIGTMTAALRAVGNFKPGMLVSTISVLINIVVAPFLIFGWSTGRAFGVTGAPAVYDRPPGTPATDPLS